MSNRKPLRRTAWSLVLGGLGLLAAVVIAGYVASTHGQPVGPGHQATWAAGETITLFRPLRPGSPPAGSWANCVAGEETIYVTVGEPIPSPGTTVSITCDDEVLLYTGASRVVSEFVRGKLIMLPISMVVIGLVLFVPRLLWTMAWFSTPRSKTTLDDIWGPKR